MNSDFQAKLQNLIDASGGRIWLVSGDRDSETQAALWADAVQKYGPDEARNWVAPPGHSNHEKGIAADLGGDLNLAHQLAPQFGLYFPMDWEEWHIEPIGSREQSSADSYTIGPKGEQVQTGIPITTSAPDYNSILRSLIGGGVDIFTPQQDPMFAEMKAPTLKLSPQRSQAPVFTTPKGGPDGIDAFMAALRDVESSGNYSAVGVPTQWGNATGAYQFLDSTWGYYKGYARAADAPPEVQDEKARQLMQEYYNQFGSWDDVAAAWYSGPGGNFQSAEVQEYVGKVKSRL